ncbi:MAG: M3 family metallopeptidase [Okeania sp. SIO3B5]|uniref:hypothetical protein n=1 Tax=Okeania sp. SIO3B5 TaxID=2607811 RepID=UPI0013FFD791|nr:hypothetical protein [Okeania sp. SIO3B5]NEO57512.1 M3 family metallopeptidase [Okeania sp. SIO3B5]
MSLENPEEVYNLLMQLWKPALERAKVEVVDMQAVVDQEGIEKAILYMVFLELVKW